MPRILTICPIKREDRLSCPLAIPPQRGGSRLVPGQAGAALSAPAKEKFSLRRKRGHSVWEGLGLIAFASNFLNPVIGF